MKTKMHFGASPRIFSNAKWLRKNMTFAEKLLWSRLRNNQLGYHFRRQHPASTYAVDFYCNKLELVIEVDGSIHEDRTVQIEDQNKEESLVSYNLKIIRFTNDMVINHLEEVIALIKKEISLIEEKGPRLLSCSHRLRYSRSKHQGI
ncbi:MAG: endonuclease domain-containing protein [Saprospiraceae bacterium]